MKYFIGVVNFVDRNLIWIGVAFLAVCFVELIVFLFKKRGGKFDTDGLFLCIATNLLVALGLYILSCLCVGFVNCVKAQDWHFWTNYLGFLAGSVSKFIFAIVFIAATIVFLFVYDFDSFIAKLILSLLTAALTTVVSIFVGFLLYVIVAVIIVIIKLIWFVISGFFISIYQFIIKYWRWSLLILCIPGVIFGAYCGLKNYIRSLRDEVFS